MLKFGNKRGKKISDEGKVKIKPTCICEKLPGHWGLYSAAESPQLGKNRQFASLKSEALSYIESYPNPNNIKCKYPNSNLDPPVA